MKTIVQESRQAPIIVQEPIVSEDLNMETPEKPKRGSMKFVIIGAVVIVLALGATLFWLSGRGTETTDDAFIAADVYSVSPQVSGRIKSVDVLANQLVKAGDPLFEIDDTDFQVALETARAQLAAAQAEERAGETAITQLDATTAAALDEAKAAQTTSEARLAETRTALDASKAEAERTGADLTRYESLKSGGAISQQQLGTAQAAATVSKSDLEVATRRITTAEAEVAASKAAVASADANRRELDTARAQQQSRVAAVREREAAVHLAEVNLARTRIVAPADSRVTNKTIEPGDIIQQGVIAMNVVGLTPWVVANFKETQLEHMRVAQPVTVHVDAYDVDLPAHIESLQAGSGAAFSLLPPQNATGNYVKVVQRIPVKIVFDHMPANPDMDLGPGMTVTAKVAVK